MHRIMDQMMYIRCVYNIDNKVYVIVYKVASGNKTEFYAVRGCKAVGNILGKFFG